MTHPDGCRCRDCRRPATLATIVAADPSLPAAEVEAAFDAVITTGAALRSLAAALTADPDVLHVGAPPVVGRLVTELVTRGSTTLAVPACGCCGRTDRKLTRSGDRGVCPMCRRRDTATACVDCRVVKPVAARDADGNPRCARCAPRPARPCGVCGHTRPVARRGRDDHPDVCVNCFQLPTATCSRCGRRRPCSFATTPEPVCTGCAPRRTVVCAHCGHDRPPTIHWPEGPVCVTCYDAALSRRGVCTGCHATRRLVDPPGAAAARCCDCAGVASYGHVCTGCGIEDKLYHQGRCARCELARRVTDLLGSDTGDIPDGLFAVGAAIAAAPNARSALNWLRTGVAAAILADVAAGRLPLSHDALDAHPRRQGADYLRRMLVAHGVLADRDEDIHRTRRFINDTLAGIDRPADRRIIQAYATWRVLRRLRRRAEANPGPRTPTASSTTRIKAAVRLLDWLHQHGTTLADATQGDIDAWLTTSPGAAYARDFLGWTADAGHSRELTVPAITAATGTTTHPDTRWRILARLLHHDGCDLTDRVAGCLVLLYAQPLSRITVITRDQIARHDDRTVTIRFGRDPVAVPEPLATLITDLVDTGRRYVGVGSPPTSPWLFPGLEPGRPLTAAQLGVRLGKHGIDGRAGRRAALTQLAAELPAAVLAELLGISNGSAANWVRDAGGGWSRYAADLANERAHQQAE